MKTRLSTKTHVEHVVKSEERDTVHPLEMYF